MSVKQFSSLLLSCLFATPAIAQIVPDQTLPINSQVAPGCTTCTIEGGTVRGTNLFHSFREFSVPTGGAAIFNNAASIQNILTRVTGTNLSTIDGLIQTNGSANLFLINPNGIIFGPNARLSIGGSFFASTANSFKFPDGSEFSATNPQAPPLLTVNVPLGLQTGGISSGSTIVNRGNLTTGQDLILEADRLDLQGRLVAGGDIRLNAQATVQIRDTATTPFIVQAGKDLTIQGNQGIDIFTLNHPGSQLQSGGNLSLISDGMISGDAHFAGGGFQVRSMTGQPAQFTSLYDPIISSTGDVDIAGNYTGASLLIESLGNVRIQGDVTIDSPDVISTFVGSDVILSTRPGLIIRSGQTSLVYGGIDQTSPPTYTSGTIPSGITLLGTVTVQPFGTLGGVVNLLANAGDITVTRIDASNNTGGDGGTIALTTRNGNLTTNGDLSSSSISNSGNSGNGGAIALSANGNLTINGTLNSGSISTIGSSGNGGAIALSVTNGDLTKNGDVDSKSFAFTGDSGNGGAIEISVTNGNLISSGSLSSLSFSLYGNSGNGGAITLSTLNGNLTTSDEFSSIAYSLTGNSGTGGVIALSTINGNLTTNGNFNSTSDSFLGNSSVGGAITLSSTNGNLTNTGELNSRSTTIAGNSGTGGAITLSSTNGNLTNHGEVQSLSTSSIGNSSTGGTIAFSSTNGRLINNGALYPMSFAGNNSGNSGAISLSSTNGDLINNGEAIAISYSYSTSGNSGSGGAIAFTSQNGNILLNNDVFSFSYAETGNSGHGGAIALTAQGGNILGNNSTLNSFSVTPQGTASTGGSVTLNAQNQISGLQVLTTSSSTQAGAVMVTGQADLTIADTTILTSKQVSINTPFTGLVTIQTDGSGRSGDVNISSAGNLTLTRSRIESDTKGSDAAGNVSLTSPGVATFNQSQILSSTSNSGNAGNITVTTGQGIRFNEGSRLSATTISTGKAGDITLNSPIVAVTGDTQIAAATQGRGQGGTITVNAPSNVILTQMQGVAPLLSVAASDAGKAGDIVINTPRLTLSDNARIVATATSTASNSEGGGSITLNASHMNLAGIVGVFAETQGQAPAGTLRLNPYANDPTLNVILAPQSQISASTTGIGKGGDLMLSAPSAITLSGAGTLTAETSSSGNAGNIRVTTQQFTINGGVELSASTSGTGNAGNITVVADRANLSQGARISSNTSNRGSAGDITFNISDQLTLNGRGTGLFATTTPDSTGNGGNISVTTPTALLQDGAAIAVGSLGSGAGGNISVTANRLTLDTQAALTAETASTQGGNITLNIRDRLLLRRNSLISTTAGTAQAGGNGGNITINTPNGFILGVLSENSDIRANAFTGNGGKINITTQGILGLRFQPRNTPNSDISASSQFGISGTVQINNLGIDPSTGVVELPGDFVDPSQQIATGCNAQGSSFIATGRGGLPSDPTEHLNHDRPWHDIRNVAKLQPSEQAVTLSPHPPTSPSPHPPILEA
ncbi:MAG: filamentous hemagglutinin N-terminal domain-containing protein, partial [Leptolyngbyaceae cyanobacterium bins.302]|nr:filamentous hemagglutinin N-terminal domain-containing protein [Leptolyngbyaceae cyanobacterium bins.302]